MLVIDMLVTGTQPILIGIHVGLHIKFSFVAQVSFHDQQFDTKTFKGLLHYLQCPPVCVPARLQEFLLLLLPPSPSPVPSPSTTPIPSPPSPPSPLVTSLLNPVTPLLTPVTPCYTPVTPYYNSLAPCYPPFPPCYTHVIPCYIRVTPLPEYQIQIFVSLPISSSPPQNYGLHG